MKDQLREKIKMRIKFTDFFNGAIFCDIDLLRLLHILAINGVIFNPRLKPGLRIRAQVTLNDGYVLSEVFEIPKLENNDES